MSKVSKNSSEKCFKEEQVSCVTVLAQKLSIVFENVQVVGDLDEQLQWNSGDKNLMAEWEERKQVQKIQNIVVKGRNKAGD